MAQGTNTLDEIDISSTSGTGGSVKDDLFPFITNVDPTETPLQMHIGIAMSGSVVKEWLDHDLTAANAANAHISGDAFAGDALDAPSRLANYHQIFRKDLQIADRSDAAKKYGRQSESRYQLMLAAKELKRDIESAMCLRNAVTVPASGTAGRMAGFPAWITTNDSLGASGASPTLISSQPKYPNAGGTVGTARGMTVTQLKTLLGSIYDGSSKETNLLLGNTKLKASLAELLINAGASSVAVTRQTLNEKRGMGRGVTVTGSVDGYQSNYGMHKLMIDRFMPGGATAAEFFLTATECLRQCYFATRRYKRKRLSDDADASRHVLLTDATLIVLSEKSNGTVTAINDGTAVAA